MDHILCLVLLILSHFSPCITRYVGVLQSFLMSPVELIKVTQQCSAQAFSARGAVQSVLVQNSQQWRCGLNATLLRDGIPHGIWFVSYEMAKDAMMGAAGMETDVDDLPVQVPLVSGAVAATVAWAVGYPADLIKTRIQANASSGANSGSDTIRSTARQLVKEADGKVLQGLYRGFGMKLVRSIPASMIGFTVYEMVKEQILKIA